MALSLLCWQYSYSETIYGLTNNAASDGLSWSMNGVLPNSAAPNVSLQVNGVTYYYVMTKEAEDDATVYIRNSDPVNGGYIFEEVDDWSGLDGTAIQKYFRFAGTPAQNWGDGEISVQGNGTVSDASVIYLYRMDIDEQQVICTTPIVSPECPGYLDALYKYLSELENLSPEDPYYDQWVQIQLENEVDVESVNLQEVTEDTIDLEKTLKLDPNVGGLIDYTEQDSIFNNLAVPYKIEPYYEADIYGGEYEENLELEDSLIVDNKRALRKLANDAKHRLMVSSQYNRE